MRIFRWIAFVCCIIGIINEAWARNYEALLWAISATIWALNSCLCEDE